MSSKMLKERGMKRLQKQKRIRIHQSLQKVEANTEIKKNSTNAKTAKTQ